VRIEIRHLDGALWEWLIVAGNGAIVAECKTPTYRGRIEKQAVQISLGLPVVIVE
jgi:hypothetical protein